MQELNLSHTEEYSPDFRISDPRLNEGSRERMPTWWYIPTEEEMEKYREAMVVENDPTTTAFLQGKALYPRVLQFGDVAHNQPEIRLSFMEAAKMILALDSIHYPNFPRQQVLEQGNTISYSDINFFLMKYVPSSPEEVYELSKENVFTPSYQVLFLAPRETELTDVHTAVVDLIGTTNEFLVHCSQPLIMCPPDLSPPSTS